MKKAEYIRPTGGLPVRRIFTVLTDGAIRGYTNFRGIRADAGVPSPSPFEIQPVASQAWHCVDPVYRIDLVP